MVSVAVARVGAAVRSVSRSIQISRPGFYRSTVAVSTMAEENLSKKLLFIIFIDL